LNSSDVDFETFGVLGMRQFGGGHRGRCPTFYPMWNTVRKVIFL